MAKKKRKQKRSLIAALLDGILSLVDALFSGIATAGVYLIRLILRGVVLLIRGIFSLFLLLLKILAWPFQQMLRTVTGRNLEASLCRKLTGEEFEEYVVLILKDNGFRNVEKTRQSGDQGVDVLAARNGVIYAIQCKNYAGTVGNFAVQEAYSGREFYGCDEAAVICPGSYTRSARELAESTGVLLWDGRDLTRMMRVSGRKPRHENA